MNPWSLLAVALGGALGTLGRLSADLAMADFLWGHEAATLSVNVLGAGALGLITGHGLPDLPRAFRDGLTVGVLGSYTTMSSVALIASATQWSAGLGYVALTMALGVILAWVGYRVGQYWAQRRSSGVGA